MAGRCHRGFRDSLVFTRTRILDMDDAEQGNLEMSFGTLRCSGDALSTGSGCAGTCSSHQGRD